MIAKRRGEVITHLTTLRYRKDAPRLDYASSDYGMLAQCGTLITQGNVSRDVARATCVPCLRARLALAAILGTAE